MTKQHKELNVLAAAGYLLDVYDSRNNTSNLRRSNVVKLGKTETITLSSCSAREHNTPPAVTHHRISVSKQGKLVRLDGEKIEIPYRGQGMIIDWE